MGFLLGGGSIIMAIWNAYLILPDDILGGFHIGSEIGVATNTTERKRRGKDS